MANKKLGDLEKVSLRPWKVSDSEELVYLANNKNIGRYLTDRFPNPYTIDDAKNWIELCTNLTSITQMAILYNSKLCGSIGVVIQSDIYKKSGEIGFWLGEEYWNCGIMKKALHEFCEYCFNQLNLNRLYARVFEENIGSIKVLEKVGFNYQCTLKNEIVKNNEVHNALLLDYISTKI